MALCPHRHIAMRRLTKLGYPLRLSSINGIDSPEKFYGVQDMLAQAAAEVGVFRIWFDDIWGDRQ